MATQFRSGEHRPRLLSHPRLTATVASGVLLIHAVLLAWGAVRHSPTLDEVAHLPSGISHWRLGRFDLYHVNPPLVRMVATLPLLASDANTDWSRYSDSPLVRSEFRVGIHFLQLNGYRSLWYFTLARWACIPFSLIGRLRLFSVGP